jgi:hypothetical protein
MASPLTPARCRRSTRRPAHESTRLLPSWTASSRGVTPTAGPRAPSRSSRAQARRGCPQFARGATPTLAPRLPSSGLRAAAHRARRARSSVRSGWARRAARQPDGLVLPSLTPATAHQNARDCTHREKTERSGRRRGRLELAPAHRAGRMWRCGRDCSWRVMARCVAVAPCNVAVAACAAGGVGRLSHLVAGAWLGQASGWPSVRCGLAGQAVSTARDTTDSIALSDPRPPAPRRPERQGEQVWMPGTRGPRLAEAAQRECRGHAMVVWTDRSAGCALLPSCANPKG